MYLRVFLEWRCLMYGVAEERILNSCLLLVQSLLVKREQIGWCYKSELPKSVHFYISIYFKQSEAILFSLCTILAYFLPYLAITLCVYSWLCTRQSLLIVLGKIYLMSGIKLMSATCKRSTLLSVLYLNPHVLLAQTPPTPSLYIYSVSETFQVLYQTV